MGDDDRCKTGILIRCLGDLQEMEDGYLRKMEVMEKEQVAAEKRLVECREDVAKLRAENAQLATDIDNLKTATENTGRLNAEIAQLRTELSAVPRPCCAVCLDSYASRGPKKPKVCSCLHTYCGACIREISSRHNGEMKCPECVADVRILGTNFGITNAFRS